MKRKYINVILSFLIVFAIAFGLVNYFGKKNISKTNVKLQSRILDTFLTDIFVKQHPTFNANALVRDQSLDRLINVIDSLCINSNECFYSDIPFKIFKINTKQLPGDSVIIQFINDEPVYLKNNDNRPLSDRIRMEIIAKMSREQASVLKDNEIYYLFGKNIVRIPRTILFSLVDIAYYDSKPEIEIESYDKTKFEIKIGTYLSEIDSFKVADFSDLSHY